MSNVPHPDEHLFENIMEAARLMDAADIPKNGHVILQGVMYKYEGFNFIELPCLMQRTRPKHSKHLIARKQRHAN